MHTATFDAMVTHMEEGAFFVEPGHTLSLWNRAAERITGFSAAEMVGTKCLKEKLDQVDQHGKPICQMRCPLCTAANHAEPRVSETLLLHKNGHRIPVHLTAIPVIQQGKVLGSLEIFTLTSDNQYENSVIESLSNLAIKDRLTGLPNRAYLESHLNYKLSEHERYGADFCVAFVDVDNFSTFNNDYGHTTGDVVLQTIAQNFEKHLRKGDVLGRWGGEEFLGVFDNRNPAGLDVLGQKLCDLVANSRIDFQGKPLSVSVSLGITMVRPGDTRQSIVARADAMMYHRKARGKCGFTSDNLLALTPAEPFPRQ